ncbi:MAG: class I SAM-dependent methyltransferase [Bacteroidetes bacterium]|nr:MAG: class I SAM-dependent methyltransferase [Bacteroidota bacterium]
MNIFEYGSGGSTFFWASRVKHITSVEHDRSWFEKIKMVLKEKKITNVDYVLSEPSSIPDFGKKQFQIASDYISGDQSYNGKSFETYAKTIDNFPDEMFDLIVVDGRARPSCILHSLKKIKRGGYLVVDNSERKYYLSGFDLSSWGTWIFFGPVPYSYNFSRTSIFQKP